MIIFYAYYFLASTDKKSVGANLSKEEELKAEATDEETVVMTAKPDAEEPTGKVVDAVEESSNKVVIIVDSALLKDSSATYDDSSSSSLGIVLNTPAKKDDTVKPVKTTTAAVKKNDDIESTISALTIGNVYFILN